MSAVVSLEFNLTFTDGRRQTLAVDSHSALLGSGAHCEVRLPNEEAATEELQVGFGPSGLSASVRRLDRAILLDGAPFIEGPIPPGSELSIGGITVTVRPLESSPSAPLAERESDPSSRAIRVFVALALPIALYMLFTAKSRDSGLPPSVEAPPLWSERAEPCPERERQAAESLGESELLRAQTLRERAPFSGRNGIAAVSAFERAEACFEASGATRASERVRAQARSLKTKVEHEFQVHRVRLERALATERYDDARLELSLLLPFVGRQSSEYRDWLLALDRHIELKFAGKRQ